MHPDFRDLVFTPIPKVNYPNNPRRRVQGIYLSLHVAGSSKRLEEMIQLAQGTAIDAFVIDFKDDEGRLAIESPTAARLNPLANQKSRPIDMPGILRRLRSLNIYPIARIVTFKDPLYAEAHPQSAILDTRTGKPFRSQDDLTWASPYNTEFQAYNLGLAEEAAAAGFLEVQFDYIRFPDVPRAAKLNFRTSSTASKARVVQQFLLEARRRLEPRQVYLAADVFGLTCTVIDDMRIGQYWEGIANVVDYICPMMYPSHYIQGNYGLSLPDRYPFELIDRGIRDALKRNRNLQYAAELRPWIQGFTASWVKGHRKYGPNEVRDQVRGLTRNGVGSYLVWHPGARYDAAAYR